MIVYMIGVSASTLDDAKTLAGVFATKEQVLREIKDIIEEYDHFSYWEMDDGEINPEEIALTDSTHTINTGESEIIIQYREIDLDSSDLQMHVIERS